MNRIGKSCRGRKREKEISIDNRDLKKVGNLIEKITGIIGAKAQGKRGGWKVEKRRGKNIERVID